MLETFGILLSILSSLSWKPSPTTLSPNGSCNHLNLPHWVLNAVIRLLPLFSMTYQYQDLASSRVKSMEFNRSGRMSSTVLLYHQFCFRFLLRSFGTRHNLREPSGFFKRSIKLTNSVCSLTSVMMPSFSSLSSSALLAGFKLTATYHSRCSTGL